MLNIRLLIGALIVIALTGCEEKRDYSYYMTHPKALLSEIKHCQKLKPNADENAKHRCGIIMQAAGTFMAQVTIQQADPETFGETIMKEQYILSIMKKDMDDTRKTYQALKEKNAPEQELKPAKEKMLTARKEYQEKELQVRELLAIVGRGSLP